MLGKNKLKDTRTFSITTLGCKVNRYESDKIRELLLSAGFDEAGEDEPADLHVVNTCTVTHIADRKSRQKLRQAIRLNPGGRIIVTGCAASNKSSGLEGIEGDFLVVPNKDKGKFAEIVKGLFPDLALPWNHEIPPGSRNRAFLKTGDGCEHFCTYCIVPHVRGPLTSRPLQELLDEADSLVDSGCREIVLTAIHLGAYGHGLDGGENLAMLLDRLASAHPEVRFRISSVEPVDFSKDVIEVMRIHPGICRHIHLPLQHASDRILRRMNRDYLKDDFRGIVSGIRSIIPDMAVTADVIVGFPGETDEDFRELVDFVREMRFYRCHVFKYSRRKGTLAFSFPDQVPDSVKQARSAELISVSSELSESFNRSLVGSVCDILVEEKSGGFWTGLSSGYVRARFKSDSAAVNDIVRVRVTGGDSEGVWGEALL